MATHFAIIDQGTTGLNKLVTPTPDNHQDTFATATLTGLDHESIALLEQLVESADLKLIIHRADQLRDCDTTGDSGTFGFQFIICKAVVFTLIIATDKTNIAVVHAENTQLAQF